MEKLFFLMFAAVAIASGLAVVTARNPVHSALALIVCLIQVAALFVLLRSPFLAAVQIFIYVGAVMVLFLFVVLILDMRKAVLQAFPPVKKRFVVGVILVLMAQILAFVFVTPMGLSPAGGWEPTVESIGRMLFTKYLFPFEVVSVILLAALVAAIVIAKERR
ncbi:MAG: NADH-quinone oxidoreductase subunit J [Deltaproteobacteria bacterium]|nr:NADH-quinone oxidoreductase subunit J [Deltaproteobacteria bacterium]MCL4874643.1 NADH-quinone oxidoreductase subunit J [bacterium]